MSKQDRPAPSIRLSIQTLMPWSCAHWRKNPRTVLFPSQHLHKPSRRYCYTLTSLASHLSPRSSRHCPASMYLLSQIPPSPSRHCPASVHLLSQIPLGPSRHCPAPVLPLSPLFSTSLTVTIWA